jgi:hypothetical protein
MLLSSPAGGLDQALWLAVLALCGVMLVVAFWRRRRDGLVTPGEAMREQRARIRDQREICKTTEELLTRLEQTIERGTTRAAEHAARLERLIRDADERVDRLAPLLHAVDGLRTRLSRTQQGAAASEPAQHGPAERTRRRTPTRALPADSVSRLPLPAVAPRGTLSPQRAALQASASSADSPLRPPAESADCSIAPRVQTDPRPPAQSRFAPVYHLADAGRSPAEIAAVLHLPLAEVELVLNLRSLI